MEKFTNLWPLCMALLFLYVSCFCSEARHHSKHPSAVVVGAVFCDTCFQNDLSKATHYISGSFSFPLRLLFGFWLTVLNGGSRNDS